QLVVQLLHICEWMRVENREIARDSLEPPVVVRSQQLPHAWHPDLTVDSRQENRPVTGDSQRPQRLLAKSVLFHSALRRTESRMWEHQVARQILVQCRVSGGDPQIAQLGLRLSPRQVECAPRAI